MHSELDARDIDTLFEPKVLTDFRFVDGDGEKILTADDNVEFFDEEGALKQNLLIKGNNLLALHTLKDKLRGQVKLIYIDPPYNTGNDGFSYNDKFPHSSWLTFMKNRLEIAREFLSDDGVILIQCDYHEDAYLRVLMDEIFNTVNFIAAITVKSNSISGTKTQHKDKTILKNKDTIFVYKNSSEINLKPQYVVKNDWDTHYNSILEKSDDGVWVIKKLKDVLIENKLLESKDTIKSDLLNNRSIEEFISASRDRIFRQVNSISPSLKELSLASPDKVISIDSDNGKKIFAHGGKRLSFLSSVYQNIDGEDKLSQLLGDLWTDIDFQNTQNEGGVNFPAGKKPESLIKRIVDMFTLEGDLVLDFHLGSGTTAAVAHKMGRRWIGVEQMDYIEDIAKERLKKVIAGEQGGISKSVSWQGGGSFVYFELKKYNQEFVERIANAQSLKELEEIYVEMRNNAFLLFWFDRKEFESEENFRQLELNERKQRLLEIIDQNQMYLNLSDMRDTRHQVSENEIALTEKFYGKADS